MSLHNFTPEETLHDCRKLRPAEQNQEHTALQISNICQQLSVCLVLSHSSLECQTQDLHPHIPQPQPPPALAATSKLQAFPSHGHYWCPLHFLTIGKTAVSLCFCGSTKSLSIVPYKYIFNTLIYVLFIIYLHTITPTINIILII